MKKKILLLVIAVFILIPPIVALAVDTQIEDDCKSLDYIAIKNGGIYWTSNEIGYIFYVDQGSNGLVYRKTINGGTSWSGSTEIDDFDHMAVTTWADWNTPGDSGTKIHVASISAAAIDKLYYQYLDTYDDTYTSTITVEALTDVNGTPDQRYHSASITKTKGSTLAYAYRAYNDGVTDNYGFETSIDGGNTWLTKTSPWETAYDHIRLFPANLSDQDDLWAVFWDVSTDELSLKTYDYSGNSWDEDIISDNMTDDNDKYLQFDGDIRHYDEHLIVTAWSEFNSATAILKVWDIANGDNITALTNIITGGSGYFQTDVFIDQVNNTIYVSYLKGTIETTVGVYYQYSTDNGITWSGEITYSDGTGDFRYVHTAGMKDTLGGNFMPVWFDDDGTNQRLWTGLTNSIEISANDFSNPAIAPEYVIDCPTCTDNLTSSGNFTSNETFSGGPPGFAVIDAAAEDSGAPPIWLWGWVGMFSIMVPGFFITYMERKYGAGNGNLILRIMIALIIMGLLVTWQRFDWWMIILYLMVAIAPALMSRQYDWGGAGGVSQHGWIGFCATSWIGLTIINRILEGRFLTASESSWWCSIQLFNEFKVFDLFTLPVINFQFFTVGIPSLLRWDYSFFGGNAEIIQYLLYTVTAVVAFILFCIMIGLLFNAFRAR